MKLSKYSADYLLIIIDAAVMDPSSMPLVSNGKDVF